MIRYEVTPTNILIQMISGDYRIKGKQKVRQNKDNDLYTQSSENSIHFQTSLFVRQQVEPLEENVAFIFSSGRHEPRAVESGLQLDKVIDSQCWLLSPCVRSYSQTSQADKTLRGELLGVLGRLGRLPRRLRSIPQRRPGGSSGLLPGTVVSTTLTRLDNRDGVFISGSECGQHRLRRLQRRHQRAR